MNRTLLGLLCSAVLLAGCSEATLTEDTPSPATAPRSENVASKKGGQKAALRTYSVDGVSSDFDGVRAAFASLGYDTGDENDFTRRLLERIIARGEEIDAAGRMTLVAIYVSVHPQYQSSAVGGVANWGRGYSEDIVSVSLGGQFVAGEFDPFAHEDFLGNDAGPAVFTAYYDTDTNSSGFGEEALPVVLPALGFQSERALVRAMSTALLPFLRKNGVRGRVDVLAGNCFVVLGTTNPFALCGAQLRSPQSHGIVGNVQWQGTSAADLFDQEPFVFIQP